MQLARYAFRAMGSPCQLHLYGESPADLERVAEQGIGEVTRIEHKYSRYRDDSQTAHINRSAGDPAGVEVDTETAGLLNYAELCWRESGGRFDVTSGVLREVWDFRSGRVPGREQVEALLPRIGWHRVGWDPPQLVLPRAGMQVDFGGFGKEYAADCVAQLCRRLGVRHGLVDLGGDLSVIGPHPDAQPWQVGIRQPRRPESAMATVAVENGGVASSGDYERFMIVEGKRYGHILDPTTGWPVEGFASVSVVASHCLLAGTASTVAMLLGAREGARWLDALGLPNLRISQDGQLSGTLASRASPARPPEAQPAAA